MSNELNLNKRLRLWRYGVSHSQLVLLGLATKEDKCRTTILIKGTQKICIPTSFFCEKLKWSGEEGEIDISFHSGEKVFHIQGAAIFWDTDELDYDAPLSLIDDAMF